MSEKLRKIRNLILATIGLSFLELVFALQDLEFIAGFAAMG